MRLTIPVTMTTLLILGAAMAAYGQPLATKDVSPDQSVFFYAKQGDSDPAGRIKSMVIDPNNDSILYAAAEFSGVWKSTTAFLNLGPNGASGQAGNLKWIQSSKGLRNGLTANQYSLAVDQSVTGSADGQPYSKRLLYATGDRDGRPGNPGAGLWVSIDAAQNWSHVALCGAGKDHITSVIFSGGRPFVATNCGIWTTASADLTSSWTQLTSTLTVLSGAFLADGGNGTFFICAGSEVLPMHNLGQNRSLGISLPSGSTCVALTAVPNGAAAATQALVVRTNGPLRRQEVTLLDFGVPVPTTRDLGFGSVSTKNAGSGVSAIAAPRIPTPLTPSPSPLPGLSYDIYAADSCAWFAYNPGSSSWQMLAQAGPQCHGDTTEIHEDTWAMAFPKWYDPGKGVCAAYAATDGGVFFNGFVLSAPIVGGCTGPIWVPVQTGLHVLSGQAITGISQGSLPYSQAFPLAVYLPTADDDMFVLPLANCLNNGSTPAGCSFLPVSWKNLEVSLGDASQALVDPLYPQQVLVSRNDQSGRNYVTVSDPPLTPGTYTQIIQGFLSGAATFDWGDTPGNGDLTQVRTLLSEFPGASLKGAPGFPPFSAILGDYLAVQDDSPEQKTPPSGCSSSQHDHLLRNASGSPPNPLSWMNLSDFFLSCNIQRVQGAGGHTNLTVYVLTTTDDATSNPPVSFPAAVAGVTYGPGQIYKGGVIPNNNGNGGVPGTGTVPGWVSASGSAQMPLGKAVTFFANPYDPTELWALADGVVKVSRNGGNTWQEDTTLTDVATNHGEYAIGCHGSRGNTTGSSPFTNSCSFSWMAFDPFAPKVRVAAMLYGGIAFSRDGGYHWMTLDVTDNNHFLSDNLTGAVVSVFYDGETRLPGLLSSNSVIYAALMGKGLIRVEGPFATLESLEFSIQPASAMNVSVVVTTLSDTIQLRKGSDGVFRGSMLFNAAAFPATLSYYFVIDGVKAAPKSHTLTGADLTGGVAKVP